MEKNPNAKVVEMVTVYSDVSNGPSLQTFKFRQYDLLICIYQTVKDSLHILDGILLLEQILGKEMFEKEVEVILTDRGSEFVLAEEAEIREDGTRRTRMFYWDSMASWQKESLENVHLLVREICPKGCDLHALGLTSQEKANLISTRINSYPKEKLRGKSSIQLLHFYNEEMVKKLYDFGI
ncbi:MAG: IS30 family transposase, partial [Bulleidia sp.]|nr:IS30 family transposase [Bulleidia sp.]